VQVCNAFDSEQQLDMDSVLVQYKHLAVNSQFEQVSNKVQFSDCQLLLLCFTDQSSSNCDMFVCSSN
jgi:hypothetical protein